MDRFTKLPVPMYMSFIFFNVTNPDEVNARTAKPILEEVGPFIYREEKVKTILSRNETEGTLEYQETTNYFYEEEMNKNVDINAEIYHINAPDLGIGKMFTGGPGMNDQTNYFEMLLGLRDMFEEMVFDAESIINAMGPLIVKHKIVDILFNGYDVPTFQVLANLNIYLPPMVEQIITSSLGKTLRQFINEKLPPGLKFSVFADRNNTQGPRLKIYTGQQGITNLTVLKEINGNPDLGFYQKNTWCDRINGTDGMQFPPDVNSDNNVFVYSPDVCRSLEFEYSGSISLKKIEAFRYVLPERVFEDPQANNSENVCFCKEHYKYECTKKGLLPLAYCMPEKPVLAMSAPHFLMAAKEYLDMFEGLKPEFSKHFTYLDIEPNTGAVIRGVKRLQVNIMEDRIPGFPIVNLTAERRPFPLLWLIESGEVDQANADYLRNKAIIPKEAATWGSIAGIALGVVFILVSIVFYFIKR